MEQMCRSKPGATHGAARHWVAGDKTREILSGRDDGPFDTGDISNGSVGSQAFECGKRGIEGAAEKCYVRPVIVVIGGMQLSVDCTNRARLVEYSGFGIPTGHLPSVRPESQTDGGTYQTGPVNGGEL